jgi:hypothetical protein
MMASQWLVFVNRVSLFIGRDTSCKEDDSSEGFEPTRYDVVPELLRLVGG